MGAVTEPGVAYIASAPYTVHIVLTHLAGAGELAVVQECVGAEVSVHAVEPCREDRDMREDRKTTLAGSIP